MTDYCIDCGRRARYTVRESDTGAEYPACTPQGCNELPPAPADDFILRLAPQMFEDNSILAVSTPDGTPAGFLRRVDGVWHAGWVEQLGTRRAWFPYKTVADATEGALALVEAAAS